MEEVPILLRESVTFCLQYHSYIHDAAFMEQQKGNCRKSAAAIYGVDSLGNIKNFCKELQEYIIENENNREG